MIYLHSKNKDELPLNTYWIVDYLPFRIVFQLIIIPIETGSDMKKEYTSIKK